MGTSSVAMRDQTRAASYTAGSSFLGAAVKASAFPREGTDEECEDARLRGGASGFRRAGFWRFGDLGGSGRQEDRGVLENLPGRTLENRRRRHQENRRGSRRHLYLSRRAGLGR